MDWENHLEKKPIQKMEKTLKIKVNLPHMNKTKHKREGESLFKHSLFTLLKI